MTFTDQDPRRADLAAGPASATTVDDYLDLIRAFVAGGITATAFERRYIDLFGSDETMRSEETFRVLNDLFFAVDAFCPPPAPREPDDLDEGELRTHARAALATLALGDSAPDGTPSR